MQKIIGKKLSHAFALIAGLLLVSASAGAQSSTWKTYSYPADGFSISAPSEPTHDKQEVKGDLETFEMHTYLVEMHEAGVLYVAVSDASAATKVKTSQQLLDDATEGAVNNVKAQLVKKNNITLGNTPGVSFEAKNDGQYFSSRIYIAGNTLYILIVVTGVNQPYAETARFLESFRLVAH